MKYPGTPPAAPPRSTSISRPSTSGPSPRCSQRPASPSRSRWRCWTTAACVHGASAGTSNAPAAVASRAHARAVVTRPTTRRSRAAPATPAPRTSGATPAPRTPASCPHGGRRAAPDAAPATSPPRASGPTAAPPGSPGRHHRVATCRVQLLQRRRHRSPLLSSSWSPSVPPLPSACAAAPLRDVLPSRAALTGVSRVRDDAARDSAR